VVTDRYAAYDFLPDSHYQSYWAHCFVTFDALNCVLISQMIRNNGLRQARYIGMAKTHLRNIACATATNSLRLVNWLNEIPFAETRTSRFAALASA